MPPVVRRSPSPLSLGPEPAALGNLSGVLRGSANRLWLAARPTLPAVVNPAPSDEPSYDDDYLREGHPEVDDPSFPLRTPHQLLVGVVPGIGSLHHPTFCCPKRSRLALL